SHPALPSFPTRRSSDLSRVRNAGAIFIGSWSPVAVGDYCAGSNHVLPTSGCACHSSGLSVSAFLKEMHVVDYTREALAEVAAHRSEEHTSELQSRENLV